MTPDPPDPDTDLRARVLEHLRNTVRLSAEVMHPIGSGWRVRTHSLPLVWALNQVRIAEPLAFGDIVALANEHQAGMPYRHVVVEDGSWGRQLEGPFLGARWTVDRIVLMALTGPMDREVETSAVSLLGEDQMLALMRRWISEDYPDISSEGADQLEENSRREGRLWGEQRFGIIDAGGVPCSVTKLRSDGTTACVEDVYTLPEARGHGYARILVTHATKLARSAEHDLTYLIADADNWPQHLYGRLGYLTVGEIRVFHQDVSPGS